MGHPDSVTLAWDDYIALEDRAKFAEDRIRILRRAARTHSASITWNVWRLRAIIRSVISTSLGSVFNTSVMGIPLLVGLYPSQTWKFARNCAGYVARRFGLYISRLTDDLRHQLVALRFGALVEINQITGGGIMLRVGFFGQIQLRLNTCRQNLAQLYAPLIKRVDAPNDTLNENFVLIKRNQGTQRASIHFIQQESVSGAITTMHLMFHNLLNPRGTHTLGA